MRVPRAALLLSCVCCLTLTGCCSALTTRLRPTPTPTRTPTSTPTRTLVPTSTPTPTFTPVPTNTPWPTATFTRVPPTPTATRSARIPVREDVAAFMADLATALAERNWEIVMREEGSLLIKAGDGPGVVLAYGGRVGMTSRLVLICYAASKTKFSATQANLRAINTMNVEHIGATVLLTKDGAIAFNAEHYFEQELDVDFLSKHVKGWVAALYHVEADLAKQLR